MKTRYVVLFLAGVFLFLNVQVADAIPAFARKHKISCSTCHAPFPRLKPFGQEYAGRGFRMEEGQEPARATYDTGDPLLKLNRVVPLAMRLDGYFSWKEDSLSETDFEFPWAFKLLSGAPIGDTISYYVYFIIEQGEIEGLEDAYLQFNSPFSMPFDLMFGQFQICDPMFKREARLERYDYEIYKTRVGDTVANLTYDRGLLLGGTLPGEIDTVFQVVNGNGIGHADEEDNFDRDKFKNVALWLGRQFGPVRVGVFGYYGKEKGGEEEHDNEFYYIGPDLIIDLHENWQFNLQYLERRDEDPFFQGSGVDEYETRGGFAELHYFPQGQDGRWAISALYNKVDSDDAAAELQSFSLTATHLLARNIKLIMEAGRETEEEVTRVSIGVVAAF
jgi:hypothetical protein